MFGKRLSESLSFQKVPLAIVAAVGLLRLVLSLAGLPDSAVAWVSMTVAGWAAALYYGVVVYKRGYGSYRQILPLLVNQAVVVQSIAVLGILLAIAGWPNIYAAPEYSGPGGGAPNQWVHALAHLTIGLVVPVLLWWAGASVALRITKAIARRPAVA